MSTQETAAWAQVAAAALTFLAAVWAVRAAYRAPKLAAELAESLRRQSEQADQKNRTQLFVFTTLMQFRRAYANPNAVQALNLVEVAFFDVPKVRQAYKYFIDGTYKPGTDLIERYSSLLEKIAHHMGFSDSVSMEDIQRSYYPDILVMADKAQIQDIEARLEASEKAKSAKASQEKES